MMEIKSSSSLFRLYVVQTARARNGYSAQQTDGSQAGMAHKVHGDEKCPPSASRTYQLLFLGAGSVADLCRSTVRNAPHDRTLICSIGPTLELKVVDVIHKVSESRTHNHSVFVSEEQPSSNNGRS